MKIPTPIASLLFLVLLALPADAFDTPGHIIVAKIAYDYLNPHARAKVDSLSAKMHLGTHTYNAVNIAGWADQVKHLKSNQDPFGGHFGDWHFIDLGLKPGGPDLIGHPPQLTEKKGTIIEGLKLCEAVIVDQKSSPLVPSEEVALALIIHLVGDIHQPLHCITNYFDPKPDKGPGNDIGGNDVKVTNFTDKYPELHQFWDEGYKMTFDPETKTLEAEPDWDPFSITPTSPALVDMEAEVLKAKPTLSVTLEGDYYKTWALETYELGKTMGYGGLDPKDYDFPKLSVTIDRTYEENVKQVTQRQICLAGLRLAAVLDKLYP
ncbi:MAG TPA: S1/P1 nuclease [Chthoniobacterales bacterium]|nr:S1/P1 nuclease [Chthoniobacterales bacterium]